LATLNRWIYTHITTNATTNVKLVPGLLHTVAINTRGTTTSQIGIYDNSNGSTNAGTMAIIDATASGIGQIIYDAQMKNGITIVTSGTGTPPDITVLWG
jgi:hypothetical protein